MATGSSLAQNHSRSQNPPPELTTPLVQISDPPVQIPPVLIFLPDPPPVQILLPDPPPVVETLESTLMDDSSINQIMSSVFGDCSQLSTAHTQEPQLLDTVPSLIDESNDLISFLDNFETGKQSHVFVQKIPSLETRACKKMVSVKDLLDQCRHRTTIVFGNLGRWPDRVTYFEQDYPYTIIFETNFGVHIPRSFGNTVIVFTIHLDLTWDKGVELKFFQVGRPLSHRVWEAYQPQTTDAYSLDFTDCPQVGDVYVKWLT
ncbi:uncharacterized protein TNCV_4055711 [Trichonephila clavipes]|nr:uncharacterized protein TNCV_4055711 [Trichonephila clavipes]